MSPLSILLIVPVVTSLESGFSTINNILNGIENILDTNIISGKENGISEDANLNITELGEKYGYNVETHSVETEDNYVLNFHRIPSVDSPVVFLMHGLLDSADCWLLQGPGKSLAYILADEGFDVWMGNARGNKYSKGHRVLNSSDIKYWQFSWEEIGLYDLPAMLDYISNRTNQDVFYIGHSQGTTSYFVMNSFKEDVKVKKMYALSPVAWMKNTKSPILRLLNNELVKLILPSINIVPNTKYLRSVFAIICYFVPSGCDNALQIFIGNENNFMNSTLLPVILKHFPTESSIFQIIHYFQLVDSGRFCRYDHGILENLIEYGLMLPPDYNMTNIRTPISLFYSKNDRLSDASDVATLRKNLPNVQEAYYIDGFNHFDYLYASVAKFAIYDTIIKDIRENIQLKIS